jgi:hypothetical protein
VTFLLIYRKCREGSTRMAYRGDRCTGVDLIGFSRYWVYRG